MKVVTTWMLGSKRRSKVECSFRNFGTAKYCEAIYLLENTVDTGDEELERQFPRSWNPRPVMQISSSNNSCIISRLLSSEFGIAKYCPL